MSPDLIVYSRWDGRSDPRSLDPEALLAALADDLIVDGDLERATQRLMRWGTRGPDGLAGLANLVDQAQQARQTAGEADGPSADLDALLDQLQRALASGDPSLVDSEQAAALLGEPAGEAVETLQQIVPTLLAAGLLRLGDAALELTPRAVRFVGQRALMTIFRHLRPEQSGQHAGPRRGGGGEPDDASRPYRFGDPWWLDLQATLRGALLRAGPGLPVPLTADDLSVFEASRPRRSATVLALDVSRSMLVRGCFVAARRVALALQTLIQTTYPADALAIITFAHEARPLDAIGLVGLRVDERDYGTNLHQALHLARAMLRRYAGFNKQIIVITDGEPTAHDEDGRVFFSYPPHPRTIQTTLREVVQCTRERVVINTFMLDRGQHLADFVERVTRLNRGRSFVTTPDRLGEYVLTDFIGQRRR